MELPDREEAKGLEVPELEKVAMVGGSEAVAAPKRGGGGSAGARVRICF